MGFVTYLLCFRNAFLDEHVSLKRAKIKSLKRATNHFEKYKSSPDGGTTHHPSPNPSRFSTVPARAGVRSYIYSETLVTWRRAHQQREFLLQFRVIQLGLTVGSQRYPLQSLPKQNGGKTGSSFCYSIKTGCQINIRIGIFLNAREEFIKGSNSRSLLETPQQPHFFT